MKHGDQKKIAEAAGITEQHLSFILNKKRGCSVKTAKKLSEAAKKLGLEIDPVTWVFHPSTIKIED